MRSSPIVVRMGNVMGIRSWTLGAAVVCGALGACAQQGESETLGVESRELTEAELVELLAEADEVVPLGDIEVTHFRKAGTCGTTVSTQEAAVIGDGFESLIKVSCTHEGCAGNVGNCQVSGCQPDYNEATNSNFCTAPVCDGEGCAPKGCKMTTTWTQGIDAL